MAYRKVRHICGRTGAWCDVAELRKERPSKLVQRAYHTRGGNGRDTGMIEFLERGLADRTEYTSYVPRVQFARVRYIPWLKFTAKSRCDGCDFFC